MSLSKPNSKLDKSSASSFHKKTKHDETVAELDRVMKAGLATSRGPDVKTDMLAIASKSVQWESFLKPAPLAITLLGQLSLIATIKDFSLDRNPPKDGYKWIKHPDSFRASLCQVTNGGFWAFNEAHKNMDQIKELSGIVQEHTKTAIRTIVKGTPAQIEVLLPVTLESIMDVSDQCVNLASNTEKKFTELILLIDELLEATLKAKGLYEKDYNNVKIEIAVTDVQKMEAEKMKKQHQNEMEEYKKKMVEAEKEYVGAIKSAPGVGKLFVMALGDAFSNALSFTINPFQCGTQTQNVTQTRHQPGAGKRQATETGSLETSELCRVLSNLSLFVEQVVILTTERQSGITDEELNEVKATKRHFEFALMKINAPELNPYNGEPVKVVKNLLCLAEHLIQKHSNDFMQTEDDGDNGKLIHLAKETRKQFKTLILKLSAESDFSHHTMIGTKPQMSEQQASGSPSLIQAVKQNYRFKVEMQKQRLKDAKMSYFKISEKWESDSKELAELLGKLAKLDLEKIQFKEICDTLSEGLQALSRVKEQWAKLLDFFQSISNIVKNCMHYQLKMFVKYTESASSQLTNPGCHRSIKDALYTEAFTASGYAFVVEHIAGLYTDVSKRFIMDDVAAMGTLLAYDPSKEKKKIQEKMEQLQNSCSRNQSEIDRMVKQKGRELEATIDERLEQFESEFSKALPPPCVEEAEENAAVLGLKADASQWE